MSERGAPLAPGATIAPGKRRRIAMAATAGALALSAQLDARAAEASTILLDRARFIPLGVSILKVESRLRDGRLHIGTGVTVAPGVVLTNCHVVDDAELVTVSKRAGRWQAVAQHAAGAHDLCYLKVPDWRGVPVEIARRTVRLHEPAAAIGYTGGAQMSFSEGRVDATFAYEGDHLLQTTTGFSSGASGGALLDADARLLGILTFRLPGRSGHYYAVPADWIARDMPAPADWTPIGTPIDAAPFWRGPIDTLPWFMQVAPLEARGAWQELVALSERWARAVPGNAEPLLAKARALMQLGQRTEAVGVLRELVRRDPAHGAGWLQLGIAYLDTADARGVREVREQLAALDPLLHDRFLELADKSVGPVRITRKSS